MGTSTKLRKRAAFAVSTFLAMGLAVGTALWNNSGVTAVGDMPLYQSEKSFWSELQINADEVEGYASLAQMAQSADAVVVGSLSDFRVSRKFQGGAAEDVVTYAVADLLISEKIRGDVPNVVALEFLLDESPARVDQAVTFLAESLPKEKLLFFLRRKRGKNESNYYRIVNSRGLWMSAGNKVEAPLSLEFPGPIARTAVTGRDTTPERERVGQASQGSGRRFTRDEIQRLREERGAPRRTGGNAIHSSVASASQQYAEELVGVTDIERLADRLR